MAAKRKTSTVSNETTRPVRKDSAKIKLLPTRPPAMSEDEIDQRWEQIRVRGEQISADIKALRERVSSSSI